MSHLQELNIAATDTENTAQIQTAINQAENGPVRVVLQPGVHISAGLHLRSDVELHLAKGADLRFIPDYEAYAHTKVGIIAEESDRGMIVAKEAERIAITGNGRIFGDGIRVFSDGDDGDMGTRLPVKYRPRVLVFDSCKGVTLSDFKVEDSPMWTLHLVGCSGVSVAGVTVENDRRMPNTDGMVIDGCQHVRVQNTTIRTSDDGIVLKTSARPGGGTAGKCLDIQVTDCVIESKGCALKLGTESYDDFRDISFENCDIENSNRGLGIFSRDGGVVENVRFAHIQLDCHETPDGFWGSGDALTINVLSRRPDTQPAGHVCNVQVLDVNGSMEGAMNLYAEHVGDITEVEINGLHVTQHPGPIGNGQMYDLRPTPADLGGAQNDTGRANAWRKDASGRVIGLEDYPGGMPAIFAHNVPDLTLGDWQIDRPTPLPEGWNLDALVVC